MVCWQCFEYTVKTREENTNNTIKAGYNEQSFKEPTNLIYLATDPMRLDVSIVFIDNCDERLYLFVYLSKHMHLNALNDFFHYETRMRQNIDRQ